MYIRKESSHYHTLTQSRQFFDRDVPAELIEYAGRAYRILDQADDIHKWLEKVYNNEQNVEIPECVKDVTKIAVEQPKPKASAARSRKTSQPKQPPTESSSSTSPETKA